MTLAKITNIINTILTTLSSILLAVIALIVFLSNSVSNKQSLNIVTDAMRSMVLIFLLTISIIVLVFNIVLAIIHIISMRISNNKAKNTKQKLVALRTSCIAQSIAEVIVIALFIIIAIDFELYKSLLIAAIISSQAAIFILNIASLIATFNNKIAQS